MGVSMESNRVAVATQLLEATNREKLRKETRNNRRWVAVYSGFRADALTRAQFVRGALPFARDPALMRSLCTVFLDSLGVPESSDLAARFAQAAETSSLSDDLKALCVLLAEQAVEDLPLQAEASTQSDVPEGAAVPPGVGRPTI